MHHAGDIYILEHEAYEPHETNARQKPTTILRVRLAELASQPVDAVRRKIADLDDDLWATREAANKSLAELPDSQLELLREAMEKSTSEEQKFRLNRAMHIIDSRRDEVVPATLEGASAARLVFVDRDGRQYVQPWVGGNPMAELLVFDGKTCSKIALPWLDFSLDCQGADGRLYGHDWQSLYVLERESTEWQPIASLGKLAEHDVRVLAARKGLLCLGVKMHHNYRDCYLPVWLDLSAADSTPPLPGKSIADGLTMESNESKHYHVAVGPGDRLWFLRHSQPTNPYVQRIPPEKAVRTQICQATGNAVRKLTEKLAASVDPSVWPVAEDTAIVATMSGWDGTEGVLLYDQGKTHAAGSLAKLLEDHYQRLLEDNGGRHSFRGR